MAKLKGGKKLSKAGVNFKSSKSEKSYNPFEEKIIKEKQQIFGRPQQNIKGKPGASRSQACYKRKNTLLYEYSQQHKSNSISDRRIGEKNHFISQEDKTVARYAAVRAKHKNKQLYNLESSEILTHNGITLNEIEKFEDPRSEDEDSDDGKGAFGGKLDKKFVSEAHFGGGVLSRKSSNANSDGPKSYKDILNQLIVDSKKRKVEKQREKECTQELTDKLDSEWKNLLPLMTKQNKTMQQEESANVDNYDRYVSELRFEARGVPSDKLKTTTEIAEEEAKTREILEKERLARMQGPCFSNPTPVHRSADDLDDNCFTTFNTKISDKEDDMLRYNEDGALINGNISNDLEDTVTIEEKMDGDEEEKEDEEVEEEESSADEDEKDRFSDLQSDSESDSNTEDTSKDILKKSKPSIQPIISMEPVTNKNFPKCYEDFQKNFNALSHTQYGLQLNHLLQYAKTTPSRKDDLNFLLNSVLRYIRDENLHDPLTKCDYLLSSLYDLVQIDPQTACSTFIEILQEIKTEYWAKKCVNVGILLWFKVVVQVFSVSDFRHAVSTPALVVLEEMLHSESRRLQTRRNVVGGLLLATLSLEFTWISKRFSPGLIQFLTSVIICATKSRNKVKKNSKTPANLLLLTSDNRNKSSFPLQHNLSHLTEQQSKNTIISDDFKITSIYIAVKLLQTSYSQLKDGGLPSRCDLFASVKLALEELNNGENSVYPKIVKKEIDEFLKMFREDEESRKLEYLTVEKKRPKPMRLYEPNIQTIYDRKPRGPKSDKSERDKLMYKLKQERKGALREIRKDVTFLGGHRIRRQIKSDNERKAQVKKIFAEAAIQQSDINSLKRKRKS